MNQPLTIERTVHFSSQARGRRRIDASPTPTVSGRPVGRVPRLARLMALAIRFEEQVRKGTMASYTHLAELGHVTRARVSQIMNLVNLAPDLQEALLHLPRTEGGRDVVQLRHLQPIATVIDWRRQRRLWKQLLASSN
jgi:hypothetical protein